MSEVQIGDRTTGMCINSNWICISPPTSFSHQFDNFRVENLFPIPLSFETRSHVRVKKNNLIPSEKETSQCCDVFLTFAGGSERHLVQIEISTILQNYVTLLFCCKILLYLRVAIIIVNGESNINIITNVETACQSVNHSKLCYRFYPS